MRLRLCFTPMWCEHHTLRWPLNTALAINHGRRYPLTLYRPGHPVTRTLHYETSRVGCVCLCVILSTLRLGQTAVEKSQEKGKKGFSNSIYVSFDIPFRERSPPCSCPPQIRSKRFSRAKGPFSFNHPTSPGLVLPACTNFFIRFLCC